MEDRPDDQFSVESILGDSFGTDVRLTFNELMVIDWVLCAGSGLMASISDIMGWKDLRVCVW